MSKPQPYSEDEKRLAKIHRCHPQDIRDFSAFIQQTRSQNLNDMLMVSLKIPKQATEADRLAFIRSHPNLFSDPLALRHSINLSKIEQKLKEIEKKLEIIKTWHDDLEYRLRYLENIQRKREQEPKQRGEPKNGE